MSEPCQKVNESCRVHPLNFLREGQDVLFRGQSGVGKTMLAQNLALRALEQGFTVGFCTLGAALADLLKQESLPAVERRLRRHTTPDRLVLDELGYHSCLAVRRVIVRAHAGEHRRS